jgi:hypothetical protein
MIAPMLTLDMTMLCQVTASAAMLSKAVQKRLVRCKAVDEEALNNATSDEVALRPAVTSTVGLSNAESSMGVWAWRRRFLPSVNRGPTAQTGIVPTTPKVAAREEEGRPATNAANNVTLL